MEIYKNEVVHEAVRIGTHFTETTSSLGVTLDDSQLMYNDWALQYDDTLKTLDRRAHIFVAESVATSFTKDQIDSVTILDVGAGTGLVGQELYNRDFVHIDALEPNDVMMKRARRRDVYKNYFMGYITEEPSSFEQDSYDVLTGCGIFAEAAHVPCEALNEMIRITKPGGYIVLAARLSVLDRDGEASKLEHVMARLEREGKWKKISREISYMYNTTIQQPGVIWRYQITK